MKIYKEEFKEYTKMQTIAEERDDNSKLDIVMQYEKEKEYLDKLIKQFVQLTERFESYEKQHELSEDIVREKKKFEEDFVKLNCQIQQIRSDNEGLLDDIKMKQMELEEINGKINEKAELIQIIEKRINDLQHKK